MSRLIRTVVLAFCVGMPTAHGYIFAIAGAATFEDQPFIDLIEQLAVDEQLIYTAERPVGCTNFYTSPTVGPNVLNGDGFIILLEPTGPAFWRAGLASCPK